MKKKSENEGHLRSVMRDTYFMRILRVTRWLGKVCVMRDKGDVRFEPNDFQCKHLEYLQ